MLEISFISAFLAGLLTFLAPCTFPLLPSYLAIISNTSHEELQGKLTWKIRSRVFFNGVLYVLGFSLVFIGFGVLAGFVGSRFLYDFRQIMSRVGGALIIIFSLYMLGIFNFKAFNKTVKIDAGKFNRKFKAAAPFMVGFTFALGWSPCVGPILGTIITLAASSLTVVQGGLLLSVFSLGLALPFLLTAFFLGFSLHHLPKLNRYLGLINKIGGILLLIIGLLLLTDNFDLLSRYAFQWLGFLNYQGIINYL